VCVCVRAYVLCVSGSDQDNCVEDEKERARQQEEEAVTRRQQGMQFPRDRINQKQYVSCYLLPVANSLVNPSSLGASCSDQRVALASSFGSGMDNNRYCPERAPISLAIDSRYSFDLQVLLSHVTFLAVSR
jgi:hypothetical protein